MGGTRRAIWAAVVIMLTGCTDYVYDQAPEDCGFPPETDLAYGGSNASTQQLGLTAAPVDPTTDVDAYVTDEEVELAGGSSRAACVFIPTADGVRFWVGPVAEEWEYSPR